MDRYAKTLLTKVGHIFILYQPLEEKNFVSCTQAKIWVLEICPKIASHATFFTFLFISQEGDHLGKIYLITSNQHGCRNLGQNQLENFWLLARRQFLLQAWYALLKWKLLKTYALLSLNLSFPQFLKKWQWWWKNLGGKCWQMSLGIVLHVSSATSIHCRYL